MNGILKVNVVNIIQFQPYKIINHLSITQSIYLITVATAKVGSNDSAGPKSAPNINTLRIERLFNNNSCVFWIQDATILLVDEATEVEKGLNTEDDCFDKKYFWTFAAYWIFVIPNMKFDILLSKMHKFILSSTCPLANYKFCSRSIQSCYIWNSYQ